MIPPETLQVALTSALASGGEFAEVFVEDRTSFSLSLEDRRVERVLAGRDRGAGIRVVVGDVTGYAYTDDFAPASLARAAAVAGSAARGAASGMVAPLSGLAPRPPSQEIEPPELLSELRRADLARAVDESARAAGQAVRQVTVRLAHSRQAVIVANSDGLLAQDERLEVQLSVAVTALGNGLRQVARRSRGGQAGLEVLRGHSPERLGRETAQVALAMLEARPAPAGPMPVIVANGWGGVLFHEAVGHGLEADHVARNSSVYSGKLGQPVAARLVTIADDATLPNHRGSFRIDDEGTPAGRKVLIEAGTLVGYLTDRKSAASLALPRTGNGRRQSFQSLPQPRMTNLVVAPGEVEAGELLRDTRHGLYVQSLGGGMVDSASGQFVFSVTEGFLIEDGRLTRPVLGATLAGQSLQVLHDVDAVASDFALDPGLGNCGKGGQWVPVGVGQPTLRIRKLVVGGTA